MATAALIPLALTAIPMHERAPLPGPEPILSAGCGKPLKMPVGSASHHTLPLADPLLYDPYREYFVYLPEGFNNSVPLPAIYSFHGFYSSAEVKIDDDHFVWKLEEDLAPKAERGFIAVYGQGLADCHKGSCYSEPEPERTWNVWGQSGSPGPHGATCDQNRERFGRYPCYTSCRLRAGEDSPYACNKRDHCHASTCANDTMYVERLMSTIENHVCLDLRRQYVRQLESNRRLLLGLWSRTGGHASAGVESEAVGFCVAAMDHPSQSR